MKAILCLWCLLGFGVMAHATEQENTLRYWASEIQRFSAGAKPSPVSVTATLHPQRNNHILQFRLTNISKRALRISPSDLPWGGCPLLKVAAITTDGQRLPNYYLIIDPPLSENLLTLLPGRTLQGEMPLAQTHFNTDKLPTDRDTVILWFYCFSDEAQPRFAAPCTGAVVFPKTK